MRIVRDLVMRTIDEFACDHCGRPVAVGRAGYHVVGSGARGCSRACAAKAHRRPVCRVVGVIYGPKPTAGLNPAAPFHTVGG